MLMFSRCAQRGVGKEEVMSHMNVWLVCCRAVHDAGMGYSCGDQHPPIDYIGRPATADLLACTAHDALEVSARGK
ncbi:MAG TPA: hypothetical protein VLL57_03235 [Candidatus Binataceae bacterium]|nr:hypothetical protein [Candidatus Binataceae bacterium]